MLAALLGAPVALSACTGRRRSPLPAGEIVGPSHEWGHRLREPGRPIVPAGRTSRVSVVIVGGGIAGLTAAWRLERAGCRDFILLELEPGAGGNARSGASSVCAYPWGAHYIPAPPGENRALVTLLEEMGALAGRDAGGEPIVREELICREPEERVYYKGRWYEGLYLHAGASREDLAQLAAFEAEVDRWVAWRDARGRRAFTIPVARSSDDPEVTALDRETFSDWLARRGWQSPRLRWLLDYACRDDYGLTLDGTSAWAGLFYFASRLARPGAGAQPLITWPEGNGRLVAHLLGRVRDRVRTGLAAFDIEAASEPGKPVRVATLSAAGEPQAFTADQAVLCAPQFVLRHLVRGWREAPPAHLGQLDHGPWLVSNLTLRERPAGRGFPLAWDNVLHESPSLGYVAATHQLGRDRGPTVWTHYYAFCAPDSRAERAKLLAMDWRDCAELVLTDLERAHPAIRTLVERLDVMRWGHGMVRPRPGVVWSPDLRRAREPWGGIHFAHSDLSGLSLFEEAFHHGIRAAEEVLRARGVRFESLL
jgi:glycine/D-amino acid oxidase-like deaminating enzyme